MRSGIEPLRASYARASVDVLSRAFIDNPATLAILPYPTRRRQAALARAMRGFVECTRRAGQASIVAVDGRVAGAMLTYAPGTRPNGLALGWLAFGPLTAGPRALARYIAADLYLRKIHFKPPHWYLFVLGIDPELQGRGLGSQLIATLCERADRDGVPCYLETDKLSSVRLYERHGFRIELEQDEARLGLRFWTMLRQGSTVRKNAPR